MATFVTGATGFVGKKLLEKIDEAVVCSRNADRARAKLGNLVSDVVQWDPSQDDAPPTIAEYGFDSVINLMGEPIAEGRWNTEKKKRIRDSRVLGTRRLVDGLLQSESKPKVLVSASAVGIYGDAGETVVDEDGKHGVGFLTDVCEEWEQEALRIQESGVRVVLLRIGIVLGRDGGALAGMIPIFNKGVGGPLGSGKQWVPWIHVDDLVSLILWSLENENVSGPVNASAPNPVRNKELTKELAKCLGRPAIIPAPKFAVRAALGEFADSLFFSQRVVPAVALANGFDFAFPHINEALQDAIK